MRVQRTLVPSFVLAREVDASQGSCWRSLPSSHAWTCVDANISYDRSVTRVHAIKAEDESMSELDFSEDTDCSMAVGPEGSPTPVPSSEATLDSLYLSAKGGRGTPGTGTPSSTDSAEESEDLKDSVEGWNLPKVSLLTPKALSYDHTEDQPNTPSTSNQSPLNSRSLKSASQAWSSNQGDPPARSTPTALDRSSRNQSPGNAANVAVADTAKVGPRCALPMPLSTVWLCHTVIGVCSGLYPRPTRDCASSAGKPTIASIRNGSYVAEWLMPLVLIIGITGGVAPCWFESSMNSDPFNVFSMGTKSSTNP